MNRLACLCLAAAVAASGAEPPVQVSDPWIREAPPGAGAAAGYLEIRNASTAPATLVGASAPPFYRVEMHESIIREDMASMRRLDRVEIAPGARASFAPGGRHLMLFGRAPLPRAGDMVRMQLEFEGGAVLNIEVPVRGSGADAGD